MDWLKESDMARRQKKKKDSGGKHELKVKSEEEEQEEVQESDKKITFSCPIKTRSRKEQNMCTPQFNFHDTHLS